MDQQPNGGFTYDPKTGQIITGDGSSNSNDTGSYYSDYTDVNGNPIPQWMIDQSLAGGTSGEHWWGWTPDTANGFVDPTSSSQESSSVSNLLGIPGLPPDVAQQAMEIFNQYPNDPQLAAQLALEYIRGTDWYAQNYAGIQQGISSGIINNEADYRAYMNQANQLYQQYYGRQITTSDMQQLLSQGVDLSLLSKQLQAHETLGAMAKANGNVQQLFTQDELGQIANSQAGLGTTNGEYLRGLYQFASQVAPLYLQYGQHIDRGTIENAFKQGLSASDIGKQLAGGAFIDANKPDIQQAVSAFGAGKGGLTPQELQAYGQEQAGYDTPLGLKIQRIVQRATQTMQGVFSGSVARPGLTTGQAGAIATSPTGGKIPDVAA